MSYSLHLANFLFDVVMEAPVADLNCFESFIHACLESPNLLDFVFAF